MINIILFQNDMYAHNGHFILHNFVLFSDLINKKSGMVLEVSYIGIP